MADGKGLVQELRAFIVKGNILDLAVGIVIGVAFGAVVSALVGGVLMPLIAAMAGEPNFDALVLTIGEGRILYGTFLTALVDFVIVGAAMFVVVRTATKMQARRVVDLEEPAPLPEDVQLLKEIRDLLARQAVR